MRAIANIVCNKELSNHTKKDWIDYVSYDQTEHVKLDIPTLFIGWNDVKKHLSQLRPNILEKKFRLPKLNVRWEFSMDEKMTEHFNGVESFVKLAPKEYVGAVEHISIDPIAHQIVAPEDIVTKYITSKYAYLYQYKDEIIYIYAQDENRIYSVYLNAYRYFGYDMAKVTGLLYKKYPTQIVDSDGSIYQRYYRQFPDFDQLKRSMVLFLS